MALEFKQAKREQVRIKVSIAGPAGSGKTMSSLLMAFGITKAEFPNLSDAEIWSKICIIDTESGSGSLYVGKQVGPTTIGSYNTIPLPPPFSPEIFVDAIHMAENHGMNVIIIDSLSHAWAGAGGALDQQGKIAERSGNSWTAWRTVTPQHNKLVDAMLQSKSHIIANMRAKMEYQQTVNEAGKKQIKALGMGVVMKEGIEYEFTVSFMLDYDHVANSTKDRTGMFDGKYFVIDENTGKQMYAWLSAGAAPTPKAVEIPAPAPVQAVASAPVSPESEAQLKNAIGLVDKLIRDKMASGADKNAIAKLTEDILGNKNYMQATDIGKLRELYSKLTEM